MGVRNAGLLAALGAIAILAAVPVRAHHSFAAAFDASKPVIVKGVITGVRLENPHSWFFLEAKDDTGKTVKWSFEAATPTSLIRSGYKRDAVKPGDVVTIEGSHARDPKVNVGAARQITVADGRTFIVGPAGDDPAPRVPNAGGAS